MGPKIDAKKEIAIENYRKGYNHYCCLFSNYMVTITSLEYQNTANLTMISTNLFYRKLLKAQETVVQTFTDEHYFYYFTLIS